MSWIKTFSAQWTEKVKKMSPQRHTFKKVLSVQQPNRSFLSLCFYLFCQTYQRCRLLNWAQVTTQVVPLLYSPNDAISMFSKKNFKFWFIWQQISFLVLKWALAQRSLSGSCSHGFFFAWFLKVFLNPRSDFHDRILPVFSCAATWGPEDHRHTSFHRHPVPLCTEISPDSW